MASDYGDDAGEKLFDWMMRLGQDAGEAVMATSAQKLKDAIGNIRGGIGGDVAGTEAAAPSEYARLNMREFEEFPEYACPKEIISERLDAAAIEHDFVQMEGHDRLVFKIADAPEVDEMFAQMEKDADRAIECVREGRVHDLAHGRAEGQRGLGGRPINPDEEPLEAKACAAKDASKTMRDARENARETDRFKVKAR